MSKIAIAPNAGAWALVKVGGEWKEVPVKGWHDYDNSDMVAVETDDQVLVTHSCNVVLIKNKKK